MIVKDGEGVTKFVEIALTGAASKEDARKAAEAIANSTLVKCAWAGGDPNWGRIMDAMGYSGAKLVEEKVSIDYEDLPLVRGGLVTDTPWKKSRPWRPARSSASASTSGSANFPTPSGRPT